MIFTDGEIAGKLRDADGSMKMVRMQALLNGCGVSQILKIADEYGITIHHDDRQCFDAHERRAIERLHNSGYGVCIIARRIGRNNNDVNRYVKKYLKNKQTDRIKPKYYSEPTAALSGSLLYDVLIKIERKDNKSCL